MESDAVAMFAVQWGVLDAQFDVRFNFIANKNFITATISYYKIIHLK